MLCLHREELQLSINKLSGKHIVQQTSLHSNLKQGQIIRGNVTKLFPNNMAKVQLQNQTLMARLEIPLTIGDHYHFQVQLSKNILYLKVIGNKLKSNSKSDTSMLLKSLGIKASEMNRMFIQQLISENIPFDKSQLVSALRLLEKHKNSDHIEGIIKDMIKRQLPLTETVFQAIHTFTTSKQSELMKDVLAVTNKQPTFQPLASMLEKLTDPFSSTSESKEQFLYHIHRYLKFSGLDYEYQIRQNKQFFPSIKGYLLQMVKNNLHVPHAERLLHFINGMQLHALEETPGFMYININIPGEKFGLKKDMNVEFNSRKTEKGKIDPDYCRIHFYLELTNLKELMIDMNIQQRNVSLTVYNNTEELNHLTVPLQKELKRGLGKINYNLSTISFKPLETDSKQSVMHHYKDSTTMTTRGVDYRI